MKSLRTIGVVLALTMLAPGRGGADAVTGRVAEDLIYRAYIGGLPLGNLKLAIAMDEDGYAAKAQFDMVALLRIILDTDAKASVSGRWQDGEPRPESFDYWVRDRKKRRTTQMRFNEAGDPVAVSADPPFRVKPYSMSIDQARGALDPATAAVVMAAPRAAACDLTMTIFDGVKLHRVSVSPEDTVVKGDLTRCQGRYERVAGFKAKHMKDDVRGYDFTVELREVGTNRWLPIRVWAPTKFGAATAVLK